MSGTTVEFIAGPYVSNYTRAQAEESLRRHASLKNGEDYAIEQVEGRWVAAVVHQASPPFGGPDDSAPEGPPSGPDDAGDGGSSDAPSSDSGSSGDSGSDSGSSDSDSGDSKSKGEGDKGGKGGEIAQVLDILTQIGQALGIPLDAGLGGDPNDPTGAGGPPGPPAPGGPAAPPHGAPGGPDTQTVMHMKALKPGEVPPGATPASAPAFSSVRPDHPWAHLAGKLAHWQVDSQIGDTPLPEVEAELQSLAREVGYHVTRLQPGFDQTGQRTASAVISAYPNS